MTAITTLRSTIASYLVDNTKYSVFAFPPATVIPNSCVISPSDPYITPSNGWHSTISPLANLTISLFVPLLDNEGNLQGIETDVVRVFNLLAASGLNYNVTDVSAPSVLNAASGDLLTCSLSIPTLTTWS